VGIFGFFNRKSGRGKDAAPNKETSDSIAQPLAQRAPPPAASETGNEQVDRGRLAVAARADATARKIDAIESEMSSEFGTQPPPLRAEAGPPTNAVKQPAQTPVSFEATLPSLGMSTEFLLGVEGKTIPVPIEIVSSEASQAVEEAAILFANGQPTELVEEMLRSAIAEESPAQGTRDAWHMLFDLYQISGQQLQFESLSIDYVGRFETSPPSWRRASPSPVTEDQAGAVPTIAFSGKLDNNIIKLLERTVRAGETHKTLRLDFSRLTEVAPVGCGLLLRVLKRLQGSQHELVLVGANILKDKTRAILQVGRRDESEAPWLLLLEVQRLLHQEQEFEETSMDYCVTFEVSPPAFEISGSKVTTVQADGAAAQESGEGFLLPKVIEGSCESLMTELSIFARDHAPLVLDCARLDRMDFSAAGQLLGVLTPLAGNGQEIELRNVNYLVAALFRVMGIHEIARVLPRKV